MRNVVALGSAGLQAGGDAKGRQSFCFRQARAKIQPLPGEPVTNERDQSERLTVIEGDRARLEQELVELFFAPHADVEKADRLSAALAPRLNRDALIVFGPSTPLPEAADPGGHPPRPRES